VSFLLFKRTWCFLKEGLVFVSQLFSRDVMMAADHMQAMHVQLGFSSSQSILAGDRGIITSASAGAAVLPVEIVGVVWSLSGADELKAKWDRNLN
jgi:hypothetical protein